MEPEQQLRTATLLSAAGGFLDAFTWLAHGGVFANAQSGNVVLLGVSLATLHWPQGLRHLPPIIAFLIGVFTADRLRVFEVRRGRNRAGRFSLGVEIALLLVVAILPQRFPDLPIVVGIAFVAALQNSAFTKVEGLSYNSVMTTGNLRRTAESFFAGERAAGDAAGAWREARVFASICLCFALGAAVGALVTGWAGHAALLMPAAGLIVALWWCSGGRASG